MSTCPQELFHGWEVSILNFHGQTIVLDYGFQFSMADIGLNNETLIKKEKYM